MVVLPWLACIHRSAYRFLFDGGEAGDVIAEIVRYLSPSIGTKHLFLTANMTVSCVRPDGKSLFFNLLYVPATIEWE
jgi:hypothetical protein